MRSFFAGYSARYWNRMFHEAYEVEGYRTAAQVEAVVIAALVAIILCLVRR
ncbi:hypothetical protein [[Clostridium] scindens]|uniref:hypothetical protein n=1 Tax=Clostridium scindens (strain JCM 10418 / VPI 12708) TaxID=29347 RepID=UPI00399320C8